MKIEDAQHLVLSFARAELARGLQLVDSWPNPLADRTAAQLSRQGIAQYSSRAILGRPATIAERRALSRALAALEAAGSIERLIDFGRTWGLRLKKSH